MKPPPGFGKDVNKYLNHYINVADAKAAGILTVNLALAVHLLGRTPSESWPLLFRWGTLLLLLASGTMAVVALYPRTPRIGSSVIFWDDIRSRGLETYLKDLSQVDEAEVERQYAAQNHLVSGILHTKYKTVRWAMGILIGSFVAIVLELVTGG